MVFEALPSAGRKGDRGCDALRGHFGESGVVGLAVVHEDLVLATDSEMLACSLGRVWHGDEGDVVGGQGGGGFPGGA